MGFRFTHLYGDDRGETAFADVELVTGSPPGIAVTTVTVPTGHLTYAEYPPVDAEMIPGLHPAPARQFILLLQGGFEVTTSTGQSRVFKAGDWVLFDDVGTKGHRTKGIGPDARINLVIALDPAWTLPGEVA